MKSLYVKIIILLMPIIGGCAERFSPTDPSIDPGLGGDYTRINGILLDALNKADSPYLVTENIYVEAGTILNIEAGTTIFFQEEKGFYINGGIKALGDKNNPIVFKAFEQGWDGIHSTDPTDSLVFIFCRIQDVYLPHDSQIKYGAIEAVNAKLIIQNCYFVNNYTQFGGALSLTTTNSEITNNIFFYNESTVYGGAILSQNSSNKIINNTFYQNYCLNFGGALVLVDPVYEEIQNNIFYDNFSYFGDPRIELVLGDSTNIFEQYNFLAFGEMDPLFISELNFHLSDSSPCIDAGNPEPGFNDFEGSRNDQGAYGGPGGNW
jgi:predicted outer membrane repeat protein